MAMAVIVAFPVEQGLCASARYEIIDLGVFGGGDESRAFSINDLGQVVGWSAAPPVGDQRAFLWENGVMQDLGALDKGRSEAWSINNSGQIVGSLIGPHGKYYPFLWENNAMVQLPGGEGYALSINDQSQAVGHSDSTNNGPCMWESGGISAINTFGFEGGTAYGINDSGQVVGRAYAGAGSEHAFLWEDGIVTDLGTLPDYNDYSEATAINNLGQVVGYSVREEDFPIFPFWRSYQHAFLWEGGAFTDLGTLGGDNSEARCINDNGRVVGWADTETSPRAFVYSDGVMARLDSLLPEDSDWDYLLWAEGISNKGQIVGTGRINGEDHAFLMTPVIEGEVDIDPDTLNLSSKGRWITCYIRLGEDYDVAEIDPCSVLLEGQIKAAWMRADEEQQVAMAKFDRREVQTIVGTGEIELTVSGELISGLEFEGTDTIVVIDQGGKKK